MTGLLLAFYELSRRRTTIAVVDHDEPTWAMATDPDLWLALAELEPRHRAALLLRCLGMECARATRRAASGGGYLVVPVRGDSGSCPQC